MENRFAHGDARVQPDARDGDRQQRRALHGVQFLGADQLAGGDQFGDHHGDRLEGLGLFVGVVALGPVLHRQNPLNPAAAEDRNAHQRVVNLFAGLRPVGEFRVALRIRKRHGTGVGGDGADQSLAHLKAGIVDRRGFETGCGEKLQYFAGPQNVDRAHLGDEVGGDDAGDLVQTLLGRAFTRHGVAKARQ